MKPFLALNFMQSISLMPDGSHPREVLRDAIHELAALREDRDRLDWLLENCPHLVVQGFSTGNRDVWQIDATRAAIDAARKEAQP